MNSDDVRIDHPDELLSPSLVIFRPLVERNIQTMLRIAGSPDRLRPHVKTHKMPAVVKLLLDRGITRHKAATVAECEMLADCGVRDVVLAYNPVGPNIARVIALQKKFPDLTLAVTADHPAPLGDLARQAASAGITIGVLMDVNPGRDRTGLPVGDDAFRFYQQIAATPGVIPKGFHLYDGHFHQSDFTERQAAVDDAFRPVLAMAEKLIAGGLPVPKILCGGTPSFPVYAARSEPIIELCPGTCVFHDAGYGSKYPDLDPFTPAMRLLTRVVSRPRPNRITVDLGSKSVAADPPMAQRVVFPDLPDAVPVLHNEEHLVLETSRASDFQSGDTLLGIPGHVCPCSALHKEAYVIENGQLIDHWPIIARDRQLTI